MLTAGYKGLFSGFCINKVNVVIAVVKEVATLMKFAPKREGLFRDINENQAFLLQVGQCEQVAFDASFIITQLLFRVDRLS